MGSVKDFDAFMAERGKEEVKFKIKGREYAVAASPPLIAVIRLQRLNKSGNANAELSNMELEILGCDILGHENFDQMMNDGVTIDEFSQIFQWLWTRFNIGDKQTGENVEDFIDKKKE